tara:strand:+ start:4059 stop:4616 length:558 start_codon:yes stop_codon:yes gene_type:complete
MANPELYKRSPSAKKWVGKNTIFVYKNRLFDLDEIIDALKEWSKHNAYQDFTVHLNEENVRTKGNRIRGKITYSRRNDFYSQMYIEVKFETVGTEPVTAKGPENEIRTMDLGVLGFKVNSYVYLDWKGIWSSSNKFGKFIHHIFFEYIYKARYEQHKYNVGVDTGKTVGVIKSKMKEFGKFKSIS